MGTRNKLFAQIESKFQSASEEELRKVALHSMANLLGALQMLDDQTRNAVLITAIRLGVAGDGILNDPEKRLIDAVFEGTYPGPMEDIYANIGTEIGETDYTFVWRLAQASPDISLPLLTFILSFAYVDGVFEEDVAERLDDIYNVSVFTDPADREEAPDPESELTGLDAAIAAWFRENDRLHPFDEITARFSDWPEEEVQAALERLCELEILYGGPHLFNHSYGRVVKN